AERYERGSVCLTSNLPFSKWEQVFKDPLTTAAAVDRLVHHSVIVELNVTSYRAEAAKRAKSKASSGSKRAQQGSGRRGGLAPLRSPSLRSGSLHGARPRRRCGGRDREVEVIIHPVYRPIPRTGDRLAVRKDKCRSRRKITVADQTSQRRRA